MQKKIIKIVVVICVLLLLVLFVNLPDRISNVIDTFEDKAAVSKILGSWERESTKSLWSANLGKLEFFDDSTYSSDEVNYSGFYSINGNKLKLTGILVEPLLCSFEVKGDKLILTFDDGKTWEFTKNDE